MVDGRIEIINASAGSGKTTQIEKEIKENLKLGLNKKILCLTYTNRAVDELRKRLDNNKVDIYTIHSFFQKETKLIFYKEEIIELYCKVFSNKILLEYENEEKLNKYKVKYQITEELTIKAIYDNINKLKYNERNYSRYLYGELSHDDLLMFIYEINKKFEYFKVKINGIYESIYLDEYQDTNEYILDMIQTIVEYKHNITWKLYGDNMQKIYSPENRLKGIRGSSSTLSTNYRSSNQLIRLLNNIYNQKYFKVRERSDNTHKDCQPILKIHTKKKEINELIEENSINLSSNYRDIYKMILGNDNLFRVFSSLSRSEFKVYDYMSDLPVNDLLMDIDKWEKDPLLKYLKIIFNLHRYYDAKKYGKMIEFYKSQSSLDKEQIKIITVHEKKVIEKKLKIIFDTLNLEQTYVEFFTKYLELFICDINEEINDSDINYIEHIEDIKIIDIYNLYKYLTNKNKEFDVSTQHGVKGESHSNVNLICEDNINSNIDYTYFFEKYSNNYIDILALEEEYYVLKDLEKELFNNIKVLGVSSINKSIFDENNEFIKNFKTKVDKMEKSYLCIFIDNINISNTENFKKSLRKIKKIERYIITFKIFYVACSRAREKLVVNVNKKNIDNYEQKFLEKFQDLGFEIQHID